jgi:transposase
MDSMKYIGMDVHKETISIAVQNSSGKLVMESIIETKASTILQFFQGLSGNLQVTFEEGTWEAWLYDLLKPQVTELVVCNPRKNALLAKVTHYSVRLNDEEIESSEGRSRRNCKTEMDRPVSEQEERERLSREIEAQVLVEREAGNVAR